MTRGQAIVDLDVRGSDQKGRVFLSKELLQSVTVDQLEAELSRRFIESDDRARMERIERLLRDNETLVVSVHPGETSPPEYHAFLRDPLDPDAPLFACVLAPSAVVARHLEEPPHLVFETATYQAMETDSSVPSMRTALEHWVRRVWPGVASPSFEVKPWPIEEIHVQPLPVAGRPKGVPRGASQRLLTKDFPTPEEWSA